MKFKDLGDITALHKNEVEKLCEDIEGKLTFKLVGNGKFKYNSVRVVRYNTITKEDGEEMIVDITGFPTLNDENI